MLTVFSTGKPFAGHPGMIQRNAIRSWMLLHPSVEVILFGDEPGAAEIAAEFGFRHEPKVKRSESGTKYVQYLFERAQAIAKNEILCYSNCDIILLSDFLRAVRRVAETDQEFLMVGRRTNTDVNEPIDFSREDWERKIREHAKLRGKPGSEWCLDYFVFRRGFFKDIPELVNGRNYWDNWLMWKGLAQEATVVDASSVVTAIHQNHDYGYHTGGALGVINDPQTSRNRELAKSGGRLHTIGDATHLLTARGLRRNWARPIAMPRWMVTGTLSKAAARTLDITRPLRHQVGLRSGMIDRVKRKIGIAGRSGKTAGTDK